LITEEERAAALARFRVLLGKLPPPSEDRVARIAGLFSSIRMRIARDRARTTAGKIPASNEDPRSGVSAGDVPRVNSEHPSGKAGAGLS
jgi:hypothetical protein